VDTVHIFAIYRRCHIVVQQAGDPGKALKSLSRFLGRHLACQSCSAAVQRALIHRPTPPHWPFPQEHHRFPNVVDVFHGLPRPARNPHWRKELQAIHCFLPVERNASINLIKFTASQLVPGKRPYGLKQRQRTRCVKPRGPTAATYGLDDVAEAVAWLDANFEALLVAIPGCKERMIDFQSPK
jgi:hypothetical protein